MLGHLVLVHAATRVQGGQQYKEASEWTSSIYGLAVRWEALRQVVPVPSMAARANTVPNLSENLRAATNTCGRVQEYTVLVMRHFGTLQATRDISFFSFFFFRAHNLLQKKR